MTGEVIGKYGIKEFLDVVNVGLAIGNGIGMSLQNDGKINLQDIGNFMPAVLEIPNAIEGAGEIVNELQDLQQEEIIVIRDHILSRAANIPGIEEKWLKITAAAFKIGEGCYEMVKVWKAE
jgi:hypothetical protein